MADTKSGFPAPPINAPLVDKDGVVSIVWYRWFLTLFERTGGTGGMTPTSLVLEAGAFSTAQDPFQQAETPLHLASSEQPQPAEMPLHLTSSYDLPQPEVPLWIATPQDPFQDALLAALVTSGGGDSSFSPTGVTAGYYYCANVTVNSSGLVTAISNGGMLPLVTGDVSPGTGPYPIATPDGEYIGVPL